MAARDPRGLASAALVVLGAVLLIVVQLAVYSERYLFDSQRFAEKTAATLDREEVQEAAARRVTEQVIERGAPDLVSVRPVIESAVAAVVGTDAFQKLVRTGSLTLHRAVFDRNGDSAVLKIANLGVLLQNVLERLDPKLAKKIPENLQANLVDVSEGGATRETVQVAERVDRLAWWASALTLLVFATAIALARARRRAVTRTGIAIACSGVAVLIAYTVAKPLLIGSLGDSDDRDAFGAIWDVFLGSLRNWSLGLVAVGVVVASVSSSLLRPFSFDEPLRRFAKAAFEPKQSWLARLFQSLAILALGLAALLATDLVSKILVLFAGLYLVVRGITELLTLLSAPTDSDAASTKPSGRLTSGLWPKLAALAVAVGLIVAGVLVFGDSDRPSGSDQGCNGHTQLCDKTLDEVALPATHNSMSAATNPGWLFPQQEQGIAQQLKDGIRVLLIDAYYGFSGRRVYTDTDLSSPTARKEAEKEFGKEFVEAADRVRDQIAKPKDRKPELYLCHGFCELGALRMPTVLKEIRDFVSSHPKEIVIVDIEDYVRPKDVVEAVKKSGLEEFVYKGPVGPPWPTLKEMIDKNERVLIVAEHRSGGASWYHSTYDLFQETPYEFKSPKQMNCKSNRGSRQNSLFLINNWIETTPASRVSNARKVNAYDFLLKRARRCERERERFPNTVAVDFYRSGDLFKVTDKLNGVGEDATHR